MFSTNKRTTMSVDQSTSMEKVEGYKGREFTCPIKVDVYRNLRNGCMSVKAREGKNSGRVVGHFDSVVIEDAEFVVRESGWYDVHNTGKKNVHAVVRGEMTGFTQVSTNADSLCVMYNPKDYRYFVTCDSETKLESAGLVRVSTSEGIEAWDYALDEDADPRADAYL